MNTKICPNCKRELPEEAAFCLHCMEKLTPEETAQTAAKPVHKKSNKGLVAVLSILLVIATLCSALFAMEYFKQKPPEETESVLVVWTMKLKPNGGIDTFNYCTTNGIAGFGWGLAGNPATVQEYRELRRSEGRYKGDTMLDNTLDAFENITANGEHDHLLWTVGTDGYWYIVEFTGSYQYSKDEAHDQAGIVNFAQCEFYRIGTEDLVPKSVVESYKGDGVILLVRDDQQAIDQTRQLWSIAKTKK